MNKTQKTLLGIFVVQVLLIGFVFFSKRAVSVSNNPVFTDLKPEMVSKIVISDSTGKMVEIEKQGDGWVLPLQDDFPVKTVTLEGLINRLAEIRDNRLVSRNTSSHERLKIADDNFERKVQLTVNGKVQTILFGSSPASNNIHFRLENGSNVYMTNAVTVNQMPVLITNWVNQTLVQLNSEKVNKINVKNAQGSFEFSKNADSQWQANKTESGGEFDATKWSSLLSAFTNLNLVEPVSKSIKPEFGLDKPAASITFSYVNESGEQATDELLIGNTIENGNYYVKWSGSDYVFLVSGYNAERILNLKSSDYSTVPATETPAAEQDS